MITLAIDTASPRGAVAVLHDEQPVAEEKFERDGLFGALQKLQPGKLDLIVVGIGPGSFTGIRAAIAAAKGLALPGSTPIKAVCTFDALALTVAPQMPADCALMGVLCDARRDEIYYALYNRDGNRVQECRIGGVEDFADFVRDPIWFVSWEIEKYREALRETHGGFASILKTPTYPSAAALGWLGVRGHGTDKLEPIYLRESNYKKIEAPNKNKTILS